MIYKRLIALGLGIGAVVTALPAHATDCARRAQVIERLDSDYSEQLTAGGLQGASDKASLVEVWASPETGTFTVMLTNAQGVSCILATGTDWFSEGFGPGRKDTPS